MNNYNTYPFNGYERASFNMLNNQNTMNNNTSNELYGPYEGFIKGNLFRNLYEPYHNYSPSNMVITNEQEEALLNLNQLEFATHELNLYLDVYPNDTNMINEFSKLSKQYKMVLDSYEQKYGPLFVRSDANYKTPWSWNKEPWPWERSAN